MKSYKRTRITGFFLFFGSDKAEIPTLEKQQVTGKYYEQKSNKYYGQITAK